MDEEMKRDEETVGADQVKDVLQQVASQLRYSLGNIHSALDRLAPAEIRKDDGGVDTYAAVLCQSYYRILRLTNNLSDAAKLSAPGQMQGTRDDLAALCREVDVSARRMAQLMGLHMEFQCGEDRLEIYMDAERIRRLLLNLLSNAFKYTPRGGTVTLTLRAEGAWVRMAVSDTGVGIPEELMDTVYERYLHPPLLDGQPHGLGLGLAICQKIVQEHGGRMALTSKRGEGTTVTVLLPNRKGKIARLNTYTVHTRGGFDPTLVELADALPKEAFTQAYLE